MDESKSTQPEQSKQKIELIPFSEKNRNIESLLENIENLFSGKELLEVHKELKRHSKYLQKKYPDYYRHEVWHMIINSSLSCSMEPIIKDDFPGDDSVEEFIRILIEKYKK